ncbi:UDP-N-acetylmuramoyl-L-alanine--D-glutamate ligase [Fervidibacillus halotolerans]|uniref:UDP-N-acetylmuramoylalanine--D-glutamate ligase n=1 Tax=Fervidibacillus halotolerans TaxID=2980027 RepID=A0A9E8RZT1_9BACI|nr:UDP-N-acetylmuramoyl-L-alanine--D-glutamate ligase [Fervidibacillus halotolerans]WAA13683.1 UDP-N-acetylmuramoyl-L-alanine--D-glutamate ligase [Fervidibacillus halotolerans]
MKHSLAFQNKKVLVLGLAKSGYSAALLLHELGAKVTVNDRKSYEENKDAVEKLQKKGIQVVCGYHPDKILEEGFSIVVKNPGIPYSNPVIQDAMRRGISVITEVELAYQISEAEFIAVTGTNGKTTTTTLIYEMLNRANLSPLIAGNIGTVASDVAKKAGKENQIVIELSSFQLMGIDHFKPKISVLTNIYDAHLDYHGTREAYVQAKKNIMKNQGSGDFFITNFDQDECRSIAKETEATVVPFSTRMDLDNGACIKDGFVYFQGEKLIDLQSILLPGKHNLENILASVAAAKLAGATNDAIRDALTTFRGVNHRLQFVQEVNGRFFYNDSKATNILATKMALSSFSRPVILLAGGLDRGYEFDDLIPHLKNVKAMITFGQTKEKLNKAAQKAGIKSIISVENVEEAVMRAYPLSKEGDVILLSPACASWDQYKNFEERGDIFIQAVHKLK